jgi:hypothetical protein
LEAGCKYLEIEVSKEDRFNTEQHEHAFVLSTLRSNLLTNLLLWDKSTNHRSTIQIKSHGQKILNKVDAGINVFSPLKDESSRRRRRAVSDSEDETPEVAIFDGIVPIAKRRKGKRVRETMRDKNLDFGNVNELRSRMPIAFDTSVACRTMEDKSFSTVQLPSQRRRGPLKKLPYRSIVASIQMDSSASIEARDDDDDDDIDDSSFGTDARDEAEGYPLDRCVEVVSLESRDVHAASILCDLSMLMQTRRSF